MFKFLVGQHVVTKEGVEPPVEGTIWSRGYNPAGEKTYQVRRDPKDVTGGTGTSLLATCFEKELKLAVGKFDT